MVRAALLLLFLVGCGGRAVAPVIHGPAAAISGAPLVHDGEQFTWSVSFGGVTVGRARMAIGQRYDGWEGKMEGEATGLAATVLPSASQVVDVIGADGSALSSDELAVERGKRVYVKAVFAEHTVRFELDPGGKKAMRLPGELPTHTRLGTLLLLRGWQGERASFYMLDNVHLRRVDLVRLRRDTIDGQPARRVDGTLLTVLPGGAPRPGSRQRAFSIWISDDARALPLRIDVDLGIGTVHLELTSHVP